MVSAMNPVFLFLLLLSLLRLFASSPDRPTPNKTIRLFASEGQSPLSRFNPPTKSQIEQSHNSISEIPLYSRPSTNYRQRRMVGNTRTNSKGLPSQELLDDLCSRFLLNVPQEDLESFERILFLMEQAHWFYEDNSVEQNPSLRSLSFKEFTVLMFNNCAQLRPYIRYLDDIHREFSDYKFSIPVSGAIILDDTNERCLLVKGWKAGSCWSFPRGKRGKDEEDDHVAIREVEEETGFDLRGLLKVEDHLETHLGTQRLRLFIIPSVSANTAFAPQTKKEISEIAWFRLDELEPAVDEMITRSVNGLKLYMVAPFLKPLRTWLSIDPTLIARKSDPPVKAMTVWKAKNNTGDGAETSTCKVPDAKLMENRPGKSFRNFHFDRTEILKAAESAFVAC